MVLGGCSGVGSADVAARVDGQVITESAARTAAEQVTQAFGLQEPLTIAQATGYLIEAPFLTKVAEGKGAALSDDAITAEMGGMKPTPETLDVVRANYLHNQFAQTDLRRTRSLRLVRSRGRAEQKRIFYLSMPSANTSRRQTSPRRPDRRRRDLCDRTGEHPRRVDAVAHDPAGGSRPADP